MADNRESLINQLAASMGVTNIERIREGGSYYDAETGTLYCNGMAISQSTAVKAIKHFETMEARCNIDEPSQREMAMIYRCAIESIKIMEMPEVKEILRKKVK